MTIPPSVAPVMTLLVTVLSLQLRLMPSAHSWTVTYGDVSAIYSSVRIERLTSVSSARPNVVVLDQDVGTGIGTFGDMKTRPASDVKEYISIAFEKCAR